MKFGWMDEWMHAWMGVGWGRGGNAFHEVMMNIK